MLSNSNELTRDRLLMVFTSAFPTNSAVIKMNRGKIIINSYKTQKNKDKAYGK